MGGKPFINISELEYAEFVNRGKFHARIGHISSKIGAERLGYNVTIVAPGKRAFPYHQHHRIEEMVLVLEGEGTLRFADQEYKIRKHDVIALPPGPGRAHQIINTSDKDLKFLCLSNRETPDVVEYPDSGKVLAYCGPTPDSGEPPHLRLVVRKDSAVDYFDGEDD